MRFVLLVLLVVAAACRPAPAANTDTPPAREAVNRSFRGWLETQASERPLGMPRNEEVLVEVARFYARRDYREAWFDGEGPTDDARALLDVLRDARSHGLAPEAYAATVLSRRLEHPLSGQARMAHDYALTYAALSYAEHLLAGRVRPEAVDVTWYAEPRRRDTAAVVEHALAQGNLAAALERLAPRDPGYARLRAGLMRHRAVAARGFPPIPSSVVEPGGELPSTLANAIEERLAVEGYLDAPRVFLEPVAPGVVGPPYDERLVGAVRSFQADRGITADGVLGPETLGALARSADERVAEIERNLDRWRWLPDEVEHGHVRVNLPSLRLALVRDGAVRDEMTVALGKAAARTPVLSDEIVAVVVNPYWNVPQRVALEAVLPRVQADVGWASRSGFEVIRALRPRAEAIDVRTIAWSRYGSDLPWRFRQRPGASNPLGRVGFLSSNEVAIHLHDAPTEAPTDPELLEQGCVAVERAVDLGALVLDGWSPRELRRAIASGEHRTVPLDRPVPLHLTWFTAEADADGRVRFHADAYGADRAHSDALEDAWSGWGPGAAPSG